MCAAVSSARNLRMVALSRLSARGAPHTARLRGFAADIAGLRTRFFMGMKRLVDAFEDLPDLAKTG